MRILVFLALCILGLVEVSAADEIEADVDFHLFEERIRVERDYGGGLGGPIAAGIRHKKPGKDEPGFTATPKPYDPKSNIGNSKKCDVVRTRVTVDDANSEAASKEFDEYVQKFKKTYASAEAKEAARKNYMSSRQKADGLNQGRCSKTDAQFSTTRYSDWTTEDFVQKLAGAREETDPSQLPPKFTVTEDESRFLYQLPQLDWRSYGVIPSVRDQLQCGGCYSFATTDLLAAQERIDKKKFNAGTVESYSAQYFIDCMPKPYGYGCKGGRPAAVLEYMSSCKDCFIILDRCYQYRNRYLRCKEPSINCRQSLGAKPVFSKQANLISNREAEAMASLLRWGPVVAIVDLSPAWQYYNGTGIMRENHCGKKPNHAVLIVGYDYTGNVPYYIVKNSWSGSWGDHGYVKVEAGKNTCGIASACLLTCTDQKKCSSFKEIEDFVKNPHIKPNLKSDGTTVA